MFDGPSGEMRVSEKSLELNVGAELLGVIRNAWGMPKAYLRGLTQKEEKAEGVDFFAQLSPSARLFAFQFKAPQGRLEADPYRYKLVTEQHDLLFALAQTAPGAVFYVLPRYLRPEKLQRDVPNLLQDTWLLPVAPMPTPLVFEGQQTKVVRCVGARAIINPEFTLLNLGKLADEQRRGVVGATVDGIPAKSFSVWYERHRWLGRPERRRQNPWLVRGLRVVVVES